MLTPARDLFSSVWDLARFHQMWLSMQAPSGILKQTTLQSSGQSAVPGSTQPIPTAIGTCGTFIDGAGSSYSPCADAAGFGVNWYVGTPPLIQHNGGVPGLCGSNSLLNPSQKMGATGLISTDPQIVSTVPKGITQPAATANFIGRVVSNMLTAGQAADTPTDWSTSPLAVGVARLLWLLGAKRPASTIGCFPRPHPGPHGPYEPRTNPPCDKNALQNFGESLLVNFGREYVSEHHLGAGSIIEHVDSLRQSGEACATFRVRGAPAPNRVQLRLACNPSQTVGASGYPGGPQEYTSFDMTLTVETISPYRIAAIQNAGATAAPF